MIRDEIRRLQAQAADIHNFQQVVSCTRGYEEEYYNNVYYTRDDQIKVDYQWETPYLSVARFRTGWTRHVLGKTYWKLIDLTSEEKEIVTAIYKKLEEGFDRRYVKPEDNAVLKPALKTLTAEEGAKTTAWRLANKARAALSVHSDLDAKRYFEALNYIHTHLATLQHDCGGACGECIECIIFTAMTRMNPALRNADGP
jgi:hypothetical protein